MLAPLSPFLAIAGQVNVRRRGTAGCRRELRKNWRNSGHGGESVPNFTSGAGQVGWRGKFGNWDMLRK